MKPLLLALLMVAATAHADYAECILDKVPGMANAPAAFAVHRSCTNEHPLQYSAISKGHARGIFGFSDGEACIIKKGRDTAQYNAAFMIAAACRCLYDAPAYQGQTCADAQQQR
jgi:hypothetical protein